MHSRVLRCVFFGTSDFAATILRRLTLAPEIAVVVAVTQPDRPQGRGRRLAEPPVKSAATELHISVLQPDKLRSRRLRGMLEDLAPDFFVVAAYGRILPASLLSVPAIAPVNVHASLLPRYRGAAPIQRALLDGEAITGTTTIWMNERMDEGDILLKEELEILPDDNAGSLTARLADVGAALALRTLMGLARGTLHRTPQDHTEATYAPPITPEDTVIRWHETALRCHNRIRAMSPRPGALAWFSGRRLKVLTSSLPSEAAKPCAKPATVISITNCAVRVATGNGLIDLVTVQPEGSRVMSAAEWSRGTRLRVGDQLDAPLIGN